MENKIDVMYLRYAQCRDTLKIFKKKHNNEIIKEKNKKSTNKNAIIFICSRFILPIICIII